MAFMKQIVNFRKILCSNDLFKTTEIYGLRFNLQIKVPKFIYPHKNYMSHSQDR